MVSPPQIVRNKRLARVQKYNFNFWKDEHKHGSTAKKIILQCFESLLGSRRRRRRRRISSLRRIEELKHCGSIACRVFHFHILRSLKSLRGVCVRHKTARGRLKSDTPPPQLRLYVLITPLLGSCLGRQGSSGSGSWAKTESSPEEQVLLESWQVGEYCSKGTARSRYSCQRRGRRSAARLSEARQWRII